MAVSIQSASKAAWAGTLDSTTPFGHDLSVPCASGANSILVVLVGNPSNSTGGMPATLAVEYNGVALTLLYAQTYTSGPNSANAIYYMLAPPVGTYTLRVRVAAWAGNNLAFSAAVFDGVDQTTPFGTPGTVAIASKSSPMSVSLTAGANDATLSSAALYGPPTAFAADAGQTTFGTLANIVSRTWLQDYKLGASSAVGYTWSSAANQASQLAVVMNGAAVPGDISGSATLGDITASGTLAPQPDSSLSGSATLGDITASGALGVAPGIITTPVLKNNTGTILASVSGVVANVYHPTTGALVVRKTGLSSDGSGIVTITDAALIPGTSYVYEIDLSAASLGRRLPVGIAA